jgi:2-keto-4-pentenoate hydratase/2-oxohepta-3-ene-1,7-dioic acid hydratase in catechol pathway
MRLATIITAKGPRLHVRGRTGYVDVAEGTGEPGYARLRTFLEAGPAAMEAARGLTTGEGIGVEEKDFAPVVMDPERILCLGLNYGEHALEGGRDIPVWPDAFVRGRDTVLGPYADLPRPALSEQFDYEGELGVVIGAGGRYIPAGKALDAVAGFTVLNDASVRDWQRAASQWTAGKNFDATMPIGPEIVTPDEVDVSDIELTTRLNDQVMQHARTSQMLVDVPSAIEFFSSFTTLRPGDVIATGTPGGVGFARTPPVWMKPGDVVEVTIEGIGTIRNRVSAEDGDRSAWRWHPSTSARAGF